MRATLHIIVLAVFCWGMGVGVVCGSRTSDNPVVVYYMPYNKIVFDVEYEEVELVRGKYYEYAKQYLGVSDVCTRNSRYYVLRGVTSRIETTPDYSRLYSISSKIRSRGGVLLELLSLSEAGILLGYNVPMGGSCDGGVREGSELSARVVEVGERGVDGGSRGVCRVGEGVRRGLYGSGVSLSGSLCGEGKIGLGLLSEESVREVTLRMRAKMLAEEIYRLREMKLYIMSGEGERGNLDSGVLEYVMGELELAERGMIKEFTGEERRRVVRRTLRGMIKEFTRLDSSFGAGGRAETLQEREPENTVKYKRTPKTSEAPLPLAPSPEEGETLVSPATPPPYPLYFCEGTEAFTTDLSPCPLPGGGGKQGSLLYSPPPCPLPKRAGELENSEDIGRLRKHRKTPNFGLTPEEHNKEIADLQQTKPRNIGMPRYHFGLTPEAHNKEIADLQQTKLRSIGMFRYYFGLMTETHNKEIVDLPRYHIFCRKSINKTHSYGKHETHRIL